jgi:hypothetical protein
MPAKSKAQQAYFAMCEHGKIACPKGVTKKVAKEFASTPTKGLPKKVKRKK